MATLKELRFKVRLSAEALGSLANVAEKTVTRAEEGLPLQEVKAVAIVEALGQALGTNLRVEDIEGLTIYEVLIPRIFYFVAEQERSGLLQARNA